MCVAHSEQLHFLNNIAEFYYTGNNHIFAMTFISS